MEIYTLLSNIYKSSNKKIAIFTQKPVLITINTTFAVLEHIILQSNNKNKT